MVLSSRNRNLEVGVVMLSEYMKLRRSKVLLVCVLIPALAVTLGALNFSRNSEVLEFTWGSYSGQTSLFYSLIFFSIGTAVIMASIWSSDFRRNNWNAMLVCYVQPTRIFFNKVIVGCSLMVFMHLCFVIFTLAGAVLLGVQVDALSIYLLSNIAPLLAGISLIFLQNFLSYYFRSYAIPIGVSLMFCISSFAVTTTEFLQPVRFVIPNALATFSFSGSSAAFSVNQSTVELILSTLVAALIQSVFFGGAAFLLFRYRTKVA